MAVRHATPNDAKSLASLSHSLVPKHPPQGDNFLLDPLDEEEYAYRSQITRYFYVSETKGETNGFLMAYDNRVLVILMCDGSLIYKDELIGAIAGKDTPYIFCDQIGVEDKGINEGIILSLLESLFKDMKDNSISTLYLMALRHPFPNSALIRFYQSIGAELMEEVSTTRGLIWGIYRIKIS